MNIAKIKQLQATDGWVEFTGTIIKVGSVKSRTKSQQSKSPGQQYNVQKITIQDNSDNIGVWAYADKQYLPTQSVTAKGMLKEYEGKRYIDYAKVDYAKVQISPQQPAPQNIPQQPQQAIQQPKVPEVDWDAKDLRNARMNALNNATQLVCLMAEMSKNGEDLNDLTIRQVAAVFVDYIYNGKAKAEEEEPPF